MIATLQRKPLGQLLLSRGLLKQEQLDRALEEQKRTGHQKLLGEILVELRICTEDQITEALAQAYGVPYARISPKVADPKVIAALPKEFLEKHQVLPLFLVERVLTVAVPEPANVFLLEEIERLSGYQVQVVAATTCTWNPLSRSISSSRNTFAGSGTATVSTRSTRNSGRTWCFSRNSLGSAAITLGSATLGDTRA